MKESIEGHISACHIDLFITAVVSIKWRCCQAKIELGLKQIPKSKSHYTWRKSVCDFCSQPSVSANQQTQMGGPGANFQTQALPCLKHDLQVWVVGEGTGMGRRFGTAEELERSPLFPSNSLLQPLRTASCPSNVFRERHRSGRLVVASKRLLEAEHSSQEDITGYSLEWQLLPKP